MASGSGGSGSSGSRLGRGQASLAGDSGEEDVLVTLREPRSAAAEAYRGLRTNLLYSLVDADSRVVVLTSPGPREGKSTSCANLGVALAQADEKTLLVDCGLRDPALHAIFGLENDKGLVDVLAGDHAPQEIWHEPLSGLKVVTAGLAPPNPAELLGSGSFSEFLGGARREFDYVLLDAPPVGTVADPTILAPQSDAVLLVVDARGTRKAALQQAVRSIEAVGAGVAGTIMNNAGTQKNASYPRRPKR